MSLDSSARASIRERLHPYDVPLIVFAVAIAVYGSLVLRFGLGAASGSLALTGGIMVAVGALMCVAAAVDSGPDVPAGGPGEIARMSQAEFDLLLDEVERQARMPSPPAAPSDARPCGGEDEFARLVANALDELPEFVQDELRRGNLAVVISDRGCEWGLLGLYCGGTSAGDEFHHRITIFRDTLTDHFGHDPDELRRQVAITVRHEVAHHFGADERRVQALGL